MTMMQLQGCSITYRIGVKEGQSDGRFVPKALIPEQARNVWSHLRLQSDGMTFLNPNRSIYVINTRSVD
jgi:hypothetical protein